jgi:hypothetical protein
VANRPVYVVLGVNMQGERDVLGLWVGNGGEGSKYWTSVYTCQCFELDRWNPIFADDSFRLENVVSVVQ